MKNANALSIVVLSAGVLLGGRTWGVDSTPEGGSFHDGSTWANGTVPSSGGVNIVGPGEVVYSKGSSTFSGVCVLSRTGGTATFRQTGGYMATTGDFNIGDNNTVYANSMGYVYITGGTNKLTGTGKAWTVGRRQHNAIAEVSEAGVLDCSISPLYLDPTWAGGSKTAEFHLKPGGTFIGSVNNGNVGKNAKFVFDGGLFVPTAAKPFIGADRVFVAEGGVIIDTEARDISISQKLQANVEQPGGLVKLGSGSLTLSGANAYAGPTIVSNGTLSVDASSSLPNFNQPGFVTVCSGATLTLGAGWTDAQKTALRNAITVEEGGNFGDPKTFDTPSADVTDDASYSNPDGGAKTGAYGLTLTGANDFGGLFTIKEGSLAAAFGVGLGSQDALRLAGGQYAGWNGLVATPLGTGAGQMSFVSGTASGFSAFTGDTTVRMGGSATNVFSYGDALFTPGTFVLNDTRAKGTLTVENPLDLNNRTVNVAVRSTAHPAVLAGGVRSTGGGGTLKLTSSASTLLKLAGTNEFNALYLDTGNIMLAPGSTNTISTLRVEQSDLTFDGSKSVVEKLENGKLWSSQAKNFIVTNDAVASFGILELNIGTARQFSGLVEADVLRLGPYNFASGSPVTYRYYLQGGTLRGKQFYLGDMSSEETVNGVCELHQSGGLVQGGYWSTDFILGQAKLNESRYYLRGGRFEMPGVANDGKQKAVLIANSGKALLEVSGTGVLSAPYVYLCSWSANNTNAVGELRLLTGGTIETRLVGNYQSGCNSTVVFDGGTLKFMPFNGQNPISTAFQHLKHLYMGINGLVLDSDHAQTAAQPFLAAPDQTALTYDRAAWRTTPAFVKKGTGTFTLKGANTYLCATAVEAGTLALAAGAKLPEASVVRVATGATLNLGSEAATVKLLAGTGTVQGNVTISDALAADADTLAAGTGLTVAGAVTFGPEAVIDVRGVDEEGFTARRALVTATTPFETLPPLFVNGAPATGPWQLVRSADGCTLALARIRGTTVYFR